MRAYPGFYVANSVYAMFPFTVPKATQEILQKLGTAQDHDFSPPSLVQSPLYIFS